MQVEAPLTRCSMHRVHVVVEIDTSHEQKVSQYTTSSAVEAMQMQAFHKSERLLNIWNPFCSSAAVLITNNPYKNMATFTNCTNYTANACHLEMYDGDI